MTTSQKALWGSTLKTAGLSLFGTGAITVPAGAPAWISVAIIVIGVLLQIVGIIFGHFAQADLAVQSSSNTDVITKAQVAGTLPPAPPTPSKP